MNGDTVADSKPELDVVAVTESEGAAKEAAFRDAVLEKITEMFNCGMCCDLLLDPVTVPCCGKTFCRSCMQTWIRTSVRQAGVPRCPGGCQEKLSYRLPARTQTIQSGMEELIPEALAERRRQEQEDEDAVEKEQLIGGFKAWQEVAASTQLIFEGKIGVHLGTPGIVVGNDIDGRHLTVKFDRREDESELCVNVLPQALMEPLPGGFRLGQIVVAMSDFLIDGKVSVKLGTEGIILNNVGEGCFAVEFQDAQDAAGKTVSVDYQQLMVQRELIGSYMVGQKVAASRDLIVGSNVAVMAGRTGIVVCEFSDTRLTVAFEKPDAPPLMVNVLPMEIMPVAAPSVQAGQTIEAIEDILREGSMIPKGTRGIVLAVSDESEMGEHKTVRVSWESDAQNESSPVQVNLVAVPDN